MSVILRLRRAVGIALIPTAVVGCATVTLNGHTVGAKFWQDRQEQPLLAIAESDLQCSRNELQVKVLTLNKTGLLESSNRVDQVSVTGCGGIVRYKYLYPSWIADSAQPTAQTPAE